MCRSLVFQGRISSVFKVQSFGIRQVFSSSPLVFPDVLYLLDIADFSAKALMSRTPPRTHLASTNFVLGALVSSNFVTGPRGFPPSAVPPCWPLILVFWGCRAFRLLGLQGFWGLGILDSGLGLRFSTAERPWSGLFLEGTAQFQREICKGFRGGL